MEESKQAKNPLWGLLLPHKPSGSAFILLSILVVVATALELALPLYSSYLVDSISAEGIDITIIVGLIALVLITAGLEATLGWYGGRIGHGINRRLRYSLIGRLLHSQSQSLDSEHSAELSARVVNDSKEVKTVLAEDLIGLLSGSVSLIAVIVIMFTLDWRLTLVLISCVFMGFLLITPIAMMMTSIGKATQAAEANLLKYVTEWMRYGKLIKAHNAEDELQDQSQSLLDACYAQEMRATKVLALIGPISNLILMLSMIAILGFSAYWLQQGTMTLGTITAFLLYLFGLTFPLMAMAMFFSNFNKAIGAASRLSEISQLPLENMHATTGAMLSNVEQLAFNDLSFERGGKTILSNITHSFSPNGFTLVIGKSGSGKSSLVSQLLGFYPETHHSVLVNQTPLSDFDLKSIRASIAWVDQEPKLLHASIRQNLTLGTSDAHSDQDLFAVLEQVGLQDWISRVDHDLDTMVSEQANQFSGGEKQRFAIARALLRQTQVLLLDEPTSALDNKNTDTMMTLLRGLSKSLCVIMISHNRDLIESTDKVIELDNGEIVHAN